MAMRFTMPAQVGGEGNYLRTPGKYHFRVVKADESPTSKAGQMIDGFQLSLVVLNEGPEQDKEYDLTLYNPKLNGTELGNEWAMRKQGAALIACGLATMEQCGQDVDVNLSDAEDRQLFAELELSDERENGKRYLQLVFSNIYHVDDPKASDFPRNDKAIALLPKAMRRDPESFKAAGGSGKASQQPPAASDDADDDLGDL